MGGVGSGNWYRFDKKITTGEAEGAFCELRFPNKGGHDVGWL